MDLEAIISLSDRLPVDQAEHTEAPEALQVEPFRADLRTLSGIEQRVGAQSLVASLRLTALGEKTE